MTRQMPRTGGKVGGLNALVLGLHAQDDVRFQIDPDHVLGDEGYSTRAVRLHLRARGIGHTIPEQAQAGPSGRVPTAF